MQLTYRNVNHALPDLADLVLEEGVKSNSRNGPVLTFNEPMQVTTTCPMERVLLCPVRRANPFLFLLDGLSILSEVDLVKPLARIAPRFLQYSDDGITLRGHYGRRLWGQIGMAINILSQDPDSRRVVMQIWDKDRDLGAITKDAPCNVMVIPRIVTHSTPLLHGPVKVLDLTVINRSNDLFWGMLGANIVQFSFLQEYMARCLGVQVGHLHQISTNLHAYTEMGPGRGLKPGVFTAGSQIYPAITPLDPDNLRTSLNDLFTALADDNFGFDEEEIPFTRNDFVADVVYPMLMSWHQKSPKILENYPDCDWFHAARMWWSK